MTIVGVSSTSADSHKVTARPCGRVGETPLTFLLLRNSSIEECLEYSCCPASGEGLDAPPQWDLHIPTSTLTGLPEMSVRACRNSNRMSDRHKFFLCFWSDHLFWFPLVNCESVFKGTLKYLWWPWPCGVMWCFTLSDVDEVALSLAAHSLREQVSVIYVFAQHCGHWKTKQSNTMSMVWLDMFLLRLI